MKKGLSTICIVVLLLVSAFLAFLVVTTPREKVFEKRGVTVVLESDFKVVETEKWDFYAENDEYAFMSTRISKKSEIPSKEEGKPAVKLENLTLQAYLSLTLAAYGISVDENDGNTITIYYADTFGSGFYYCYYKDGSGKYGYMLLVKESLNYFYTMNIACDADQLNSSKTKMLQYAVTVTVD